MRVSAVDMGQGIRTTMAQIAAQTLGVEASQLQIITGDTLLTPKHGGAVGERQTFINGNAMYHGAKNFLLELVQKAGEIYGKNPAELCLQGEFLKASAGVPKIADTPLYEHILIEDPEPNGPYGAKGISEVATVPITPAILNAIYDAVGVRVTSLPATPEKILQLLGEKTITDHR